VATGVHAQGTPYGDQQVMIVAAHTATTTGDAATYPVRGVRHGICVLKATAVAGTSPTLDLYLQSVTDGVDDDYCRFTQVTAASQQILSFSTTAAVPASAAHAVSDRSTGVTVGQCRAGAIGGILKVAEVIGGSASPSVTYALSCQLTGD